MLKLVVTSTGLSGFRRVDLIHARLDLDRFLRVGVDVLAQDEQGIDQLRGEGVEHDKACILGDRLRGVHGFLIRSILCSEEDGGITHWLAVCFECQAARLGGAGQPLAEILSAEVEHHVFHAFGLDLGSQFHESIQGVAFDHERGFVLLGNIRQGFVVGRIGSVDQGPFPGEQAEA